MGELSPWEILMGVMDVVAELKNDKPDWDKFYEERTSRQEHGLRIIGCLTKDFGNE